MAHIVLTEEQARVLLECTLPVEVRDGQGNVLGWIPAPSEAEIIERIKQNRARDLPRYPAHEVQARLRKLEEIGRQQELNESSVQELLRRLRAGEEV